MLAQKKLETMSLQLSDIEEAKKLLDKCDDEKDEVRYFICTKDDLLNLLQSTSVTSMHYNTIRALWNGDLDTFMGFTFVVTSQVKRRGDPNEHQCFFGRGYENIVSD